MSSFALHSAPHNAPFRFGSARLIAGLIFGLLLTLGMAGGAKADTVCNEGRPLPNGSKDHPEDLMVTGPCNVQPGQDYFYRHVNIITDPENSANKGQLTFAEAKNSKTDFWASSIIIENGGTMTAGTPTEQFGMNGGTLKIHLYGENKSVWDGKAFTTQNVGARCRSPIPDKETAPCGIPQKMWDNNAAVAVSGCVGMEPPTPCIPGLATTVMDYFYDYAPLYGDGAVANGTEPISARTGYFGVKTLAVSFGGTLTLYGFKGASSTAIDNDHTNSGVSWIRLAADIKKGDPSLTLATDPGGRWKAGDEIVVTTTDYLPGHSEQLKIASTYTGGTTVPLDPASPVQWTHIGVRYGDPSTPGSWLTRLPKRILDSLADDLKSNGAETRAAVALLTRSIRIVSGGDTANETFQQASARTPCPNAEPKKDGCYYFGAHMVVRQGFEKVHIQGVEFKRMGQGGRLAHYPVHFHKVRQTPPNTYVKDSSVNESMTRWYVIHSTQGVTLARNVGYKSIGHGYYLEDGTETDNNFYSDIGIFARGAVADDQNPRRVPGILAANEATVNVEAQFPYKSDSSYPVGFWITNGWNNFVGDMAAGAGTCGSSYWFVPVVNSDAPDVPTKDNVQPGTTHMKWSGYAGLQSITDNRGATPLETFYKNYATSSELSFQTTGDAPMCLGVVKPSPGTTPNVLKAVQSIAPDPLPVADQEKDTYYPHAAGGNRHATFCPLVSGKPDCTGIKHCDVGQEENCAVTVLDHYTSSFHWAEGNVSAIWGRNQWYLLDNVVLSDVQNGGLTFITGGDYTHASVIPGYWALGKSSVFIGHTQPQNNKDYAYASDAGPFNASSGLTCDWQTTTLTPSNYCASKAQDITMPLGFAFGLSQRLFNIYDGPAYEDSVAYLDITTTPCPNTGPTKDASCMYGHGLPAGLRKSIISGTRIPVGDCYLPNAAIAWKQPNGFFYPPAFHSMNLYFDNVDIRHYVINPLFKAPDGATDFGQGGTYLQNTTLTDVQYCNLPTDYFGTFSAIDRQTELSDDDGSLTGLTNDVSPTPTGTISVNQDPFFAAPKEAPECRSNLGIDPKKACQSVALMNETQTARTSPYDYVATAVEPQCSQTPIPGQKYGRCGDTPDKGIGGTWSSECTNERCYGIPLYRQYLTGNSAKPGKGEWKDWYTNKCNPPEDGGSGPGTVQCRWPFIRMAGENLYQRETLTVNHGLYYLDTTVPVTTQNAEIFHYPRNLVNDVNGFEAGQTYYVYFLYAKPSTQQTYQIYVGKSFDPKTMLKAVRGSLATAPIIFSDYQEGGQTVRQPSWLKPGSVDANGVVTISIDFTGLTELNPSSTDLCQPRAFCTPDGPTGCKGELGVVYSSLLKEDSNMTKEANDTCKTWAVKDRDCPVAGCLGFAFTLPSGTNGFSAMNQGQAVRPQPQEFPTKTTPGWMTKFVNTSTPPDNAAPKPPYPASSSCFYPTPLPGDPGCQVFQ